MPTDPTASAWRRFLASIADLPSVNWHAFVGSLLAVLYVLVILGGLVLGKPMQPEIVYALGAFVLTYLGKASYDFQTKRKTEIVTPPDVMASDAGPSSTAAVAAPNADAAPFPPSVSGALAPPADDAAASRAAPLAWLGHDTEPEADGHLGAIVDAPAVPSARPVAKSTATRRPPLTRPGRS